MKIYPAIEYLGTLDGGSTHPWRVNVKTDQQAPEAYAVKLFSTNQVHQHRAVAKEVFGNVLAKALHLSVPEWALVRFNKKFIDTLPEEVKKQNGKSHQGLRFASKFHDDFIICGDQLIASQLSDYDIPSIYAFDNLVWNIDRRANRNKPNLLLNDDSYLLIDHELILPFANDPDDYNDRHIQSFLKKDWKYPYKVHLFHGYLKKRKSSKKKGIFDPFIKNLTALNPSILKKPSAFLSENGHSCGNVDLIIDYLRTIQKHADIFNAILQTQIS